MDKSIVTNRSTKIPSKKVLPNSNPEISNGQVSSLPVLPSNTTKTAAIEEEVFSFPQMSKTRKKWTSYPIPTESNVQLKAFGHRVLINPDTVQFKIAEGILTEIVFPEDGIYELSEQYQLEQLPGQTQQFKNKAALWYKGERIGILCYGPKFATLAGCAKYEIENVQLYDHINMDIWTDHIIERPIALLGSGFVGHGVFRVDIAFDSPVFVDFIQRVKDREITAVRQSNLKKNKLYCDLMSGKGTGFGFGSRASGRYARVYNKSQEIREKHKNGGKDHITSYHLANELVKGPTFDDVGRFELELRARFLNTVEGFSWRDVFDREKLVKLAQIAMEDWFKWVPVDHPDSKLNRRPPVEIIDFSQVKTEGYERQKPEKGESKRMDKIAIKKLVMQAAFARSEAERIEYLKAAGNLCDESGLHWWLAGKSAEILKEMNKRSRLREIPIPDTMNVGCVYDLVFQVSDSFNSVAVNDFSSIAAGEMLVSGVGLSVGAIA